MILTLCQVCERTISRVGSYNNEFRLGLCEKHKYAAMLELVATAPPKKALVNWRWIAGSERKTA